MPEASITDHILTADFIVLARPKEGNSFQFAPVQVWKESAGTFHQMPEIPFLIDSSTRRTLLSDPDKTVLFTYGATDKTGSGLSLSRRWTRIFMMTEERADFVERLRMSAESWTSTNSIDQHRVAFFADYLSSQDKALRDVALIEMHRAPYELIHGVEISVPTDQLLIEFSRVDRVSFVPVSIRLLGLQTDENAAQVVRSNFAEVLQSNKSNVYEWALAGIEVDGLSAIRAIGNALPQIKDNPGKQKALIKALADGGTVRPEYRPHIIDAFSRVLANDSSSAARIATTLQKWNSTELNPELRALLKGDEIDPATRFILRSVLDTERASD